MSADFYYSIDTSALVHGWVRAYPQRIRMFKLCLSGWRRHLPGL